MARGTSDLRSSGWRWSVFAAVFGASIATATRANAQESAPAARPRIDQPELVRPVPPAPPPPVSRTYMNCVGCAIAGGIVLGAGAVHALVGGLEMADGNQDDEAGRALLITGALHGLVGIPLLVAGLWPLERTGARAALSFPLATPSSPASPMTPSPTSPVDIAVGPIGGSLKVRF